MDNNKWYLNSPNQPNWEAIYKKINENGIDSVSDLPSWITQQINDFPNANLGPISGDSQLSKHWMENTTVDEVVERAKKQGYYQDTYFPTDTERKMGRSFPNGEMPLNAENINSQLKNLTVEDMINYSKDNGIDIPDIIPDNERIGLDYAQKNRSIIKDHDALNRERKHLEHIDNLKNKQIPKSTPGPLKPNTNVTNPKIPRTYEDALSMKGFNTEGRLTRMVENEASNASKKVVNEQMQKEIAEDVSKNLKKSTMKNLGHVMNAGFAIMDYKDSREAGHSVGKSVVKAGAEFAKGELLGGWYMATMLAKSVPTIAVSAIEGLNTMSRTMNSMQRRQLFGEAQFMDTQQLATMRQSGMELAKMSQYNLQQSLMGNEAEHLHRL